MSEVQPLRVIQWGTGAVGVHALRFVLGAPGLQLVGAQCFTEAKDGRDVGSLAGLSPAGVFATRDTDALLALDADCVLFMPRDTFLDPTVAGSEAKEWVDQIVTILAGGKNVVSPLQSAMHWRQLANGADLRARLDAACREGGVSLFFTGLDPGFVSDCLAMTVASVVGSITQIRTSEVIDYDTYGSPTVLESMGFGKAAGDSSDASNDSLIPSWGCAMWLLADSLGVELDDIALSTDSYPAPADYTSAGGTRINAGTVGALQWSLTGIVDGRPLLIANHVARMGAHMAPDWPQIGERGGYRVEVDGMPPLRAELPLGLPGGTGSCLGDAVVMTAARCVNAISAVVNAPVGYQLLNDMQIVGARHGRSSLVLGGSS